MKIAIMTDSTAYMPIDLREKHNIYMVPLSVVFGKDSYREEIDITTEEFYKKVRETETLPSTSQPSIGSFVDIYEKLAAQNYDAVITIHLSSKISGTYEVAQSAGDMVEGIDVYAFDSGLSTMPQGFYAIEASEMVADNKSPEEIIAVLEEMKKNTRSYFMVNDLSHLQRGGRLSGTQALFGGLLKIKPILHLVEGEIIPFEKIRTRKKALSRIFGMLEKDVEKGLVKKVVFIHANDETSAIELDKQFLEKHSNIETVISYFGPVIGTHLGEGSLGVSWYNA